MSDELKDFGKFPLQPSELRTILGPSEVPRLTTDSGMLALKGLVDRLFREVQQLELRKQEVLVQLVAVNEILQTKVKQGEVDGLKAKKRNGRVQPGYTNGSGPKKKP
jgi:hypothetical protein